MKQAEFLYREMLLMDARKCRYPRLATFLVKWFWWMADDRFFVPLAVIGLSTTLLGLIALIATLAYVTIITFPLG